MVLDKIVLKDFLSYDYLEHEFVKRPLQIQGKNLTDEGQQSIGSGKSGLQTAIEYCIASSNSRGVKDDEIVSFGCEESNVQLYASCDVRKESIHIDWTIKLKGSNKLKLRKKPYGGEWSEVTFSNVADGKKYVSAWFAISKDDLFNYYIVNRNRFKTFFQSSNKEKVDLINRFSDASITDGIEKIDNSELEEEYDNLNSQISRIEGKIEITSERIESEKSRDFKSEMQEELEEIDEEIDSIEESIIETKESIELVKSQNEDIENRKKELDAEIEEIEEEKSKINSKIDAENKLLLPIEKELKKAQSLVDEFASTDWDRKRSDYEKELSELSKNIESSRQSLEKQESQKTKILSLLSQLEVKLSSAIICPSCDYEFILNEDIDVVKDKQSKATILKNKVESSIKSSEKSILSIKSSVSDIETKISSINKREETENKNKNLLIESVNRINTSVSKIEKNINSFKSEISELDEEKTDTKDSINELSLEIKDNENLINSYNGKIKGFESEIKSYKEKKKLLKPGNNKQLIKELKLEIKSFEKEISELRSKSQVLGDNIFERNQWKNNFKQFKMYLANQSLETIEFHCNRYLKGMKTDLRTKLEGYKLLASGKIKDEITAKIVRNGVERSFGSYSGGERAKIIMAGILANRHMINSTHPYGGLDFLSIDEITEGLDPNGIKDLVEVMKGLQIPIYMITHVLSDVIDEDIMLIVKENGVSRIQN